MINLNELTSPSSCISQHCHLLLAPHFCGRPAGTKSFKKRFAGVPQASKPLKSDLREARKVYKQKKHSEEMNLQSAL